MTDLLVLSPESTYPDELEWVECLFESGLTRLHVRKPGWSPEELRRYILEIPEVCWPKLVLHKAYELVNELGLGGWHIKDDTAHLKEAAQFQEYRSQRKTLSRSVHQLDDLKEDQRRWDYSFFSPVFDSISKTGYKPRYTVSAISEKLLDESVGLGSRVYALGGIHRSNIRQCIELGFHGVALLGAIWHNDDPLASYQELRELSEVQAIR